MTKRHTVYRVCLWVLTLVWGGMICLFSLQSGPQSTALSSGLTQTILEWFPSYNALSLSQQAMVLAKAQGVMRELAHIAEYAVLGVLVALLVRSYRSSRFAVITLGVTAVFAVIDECVQEFLSIGRAFQVIDLLKDWFGACLGIGCIWLVCLIIRRVQYRRKAHGHA